MFAPDQVDNVFEAEFDGPDLAKLRDQWKEQLAALFADATLSMPDDEWMASGGKEGRHSEHLGYMLAEMQYLQRTYPGANW